MSSILGEVLNLALITHLMIMQLEYPEVVSKFFAAVFEFVTFDLLPTDPIYGFLFDFPEKSYSDQAEEIGYESVQTIPNLGSVWLFIVFVTVLHSFFQIVVKYCTGGKLKEYANKSRGEFFWSGFIALIDDTYLNVCFALCIASSDARFDTPSLFVSNLSSVIFGVVYLLYPLVLQYQVAKRWNQLPTIDLMSLSERREGGEAEVEAEAYPVSSLLFGVPPSLRGSLQGEPETVPPSPFGSQDSESETKSAAQSETKTAA